VSRHHAPAVALVARAPASKEGQQKGREGVRPWPAATAQTPDSPFSNASVCTDPARLRNRCFIEGSCWKHHEFSGRHDDSDWAYQQMDVGKHAEACLARARQWHMHCENPLAWPITAEFTPTADWYTFPERSDNMDSNGTPSPSAPTTWSNETRQESSVPDGAEWVMLLHVTDGYLDFFENFWRHYEKIGHWSAKHVVKVIVSSRAAVRFVRSLCGDGIEVHEGEYFGLTPFGFADKGFTSVVQRRPDLIREELMANRNVLYLDVDIVLLADPFTFLLPGYDLWTSMDHASLSIHCTGIMAVRATSRMLDLLADWVRQMQPADGRATARAGTSEISEIGNQKAFNQVMHARENGDIMVYQLSEAQFPPGNVFFSPEFAPQRHQVVAVHNNFVVGHAAKKTRFISLGLWLATNTEADDIGAGSAHVPVSRRQKEDGGRWGDGRREGRGMRGVSPMETSVRKLRHPENKLASVTLRGGSELRFPAGEDLAHAYLAMPQPAPLTKAAEYGYDGRQHGASGFCTRPASVMKNECMLRKALRGLGVCQGG